MSSVPIHGNYHGYYTKRPFFNDERLRVLPSDLFRGSRVLDVGCNEGWVTCEIAQSFGARSVIGVDIDETLIEGAWRRRRTVWSMQAPTSRNSMTMDTDVVSHGGSTSTHEHRTQDPEPYYFPASCEHEFGSLPIPPSSNRGKDSFPHNITFRTADWVRTPIPEDSQLYDVVVAFSLSKWIHLNEGDEGLKFFFRRVFEVLKRGGTFVLEPQPWESYAKAKRLDHVC
ncbi:hypothetical protein CVT26_003470 [Gymnopilus dilepis]|uniref:RNA methyltransferase n=1 Tax=Gymnopilus dilepis TaxID=231916 RepID=A0A409Y5H6_9AGAR|nr:hypothetical protein CVT26_003470 [Gymnopilus dilepis]